MTIADELARLEELRNNGSLTETEFEEAKRRALHEHSTSGAPFAVGASAPGMIHGMQEETYCMLMHLSQLLTFSGLGIVAPIVMALVYIVVFLPIGMILRAKKADLLRLKPEPDAPSYWIERDAKPQSMTRQF